VKGTLPWCYFYTPELEDDPPMSRSNWSHTTKYPSLKKMIQLEKLSKKMSKPVENLDDQGWMKWAKLIGFFAFVIVLHFIIYYIFANEIFL
jgi:hypothetical protein